MKRNQTGTDVVAEGPILFDAHLGIGRPFLIENETQFVKGQALVLLFASMITAILIAMI